ncbi:MAG: CPBP family intramembrane metalloprotease [Patescibacteria group bacterium]|nr:CPBP family intramembrane metalloprotease [Patescibacteria group bacterium]
MKQKNKILLLLSLIIFPPIIIVLSRQILPNNYFFSSLYKLVFLSPIIFAMWSEKKSLRQSLFQNFSFATFKKNIWRLTLLGIFLSGIYLTSFFVFKNLLDISTITTKLNSLININLTNLIFIGLYIIIFNSLLEEYFWRGFLFAKLDKILKPWQAYLITGIAFSFHHVMFYYNWFNLGFFVLVTFGLTVYALIMNYVFKKYQDLFSCWYVHIFADIAQIFIAFKIFEII